MYTSIKTIKLDSDLENEIKEMLCKKTIIPIIGSGFSKGAIAMRGIVPSGDDMKKYMLEELSTYIQTDDIKNKTFAQISSYYNKIVPNASKKQYIIDCFLKVRLHDERKNFLAAPWPYIYSLNIDDAVENNSDFIAIDPNKEYESAILENNRIVFKLHGNASQMNFVKDDSEISVFDTKQYLKSLKDNKWILNNLKKDYLDKNIIFLGCSLNNELDLEYLFSDLSLNLNSLSNTKRFFVTDKDLTDIQLLDLEQYGITFVIKVNNYIQFYDSIYKITEELKQIKEDEISAFCNIDIRSLETGKDSYDFLLYEKTIYNKKTNKILLPSFFITRDIVQTVTNDFDKHIIHVLYGKRVCGKTYVLAGILQKIKNRTTYFFDSRTSVNKKIIDVLLSKNNIIALFDTNVLSNETIEYIFTYNANLLKSKKINIVICINTSKKEEILRISKFKNIPQLSLFYIENHLSKNEYLLLRQKMSSNNLPYFKLEMSILDNIIRLQKELAYKKTFKSISINIESKNYMHFVFLILLAYKEKLSSSDLVMFGLDNEPFEILPKLSSIAEPDYQKLLSNTVLNNDYYQIVCNATVYLLGYISDIATRDLYFDVLVQAVYHIAYVFIEDMKTRRNKALYDFIQFDNLNLILGGARYKKPSGSKRLIQAIYTKLKPLLCNDYQFNHQHAKCLLWDIESIKDIKERNSLLEESLHSALLAKQQVEDDLKRKNNNEYLYISLAHINFTLAMIKVKSYYFEKNEKTFESAVDQLFAAISFKENQQAYELSDKVTNDNFDYSISKFIDELLKNNIDCVQEETKDKISYILNYRIRRLY